MKDPLEPGPLKVAMSLGKWLALAGSLALIINYGKNLGTFAEVVDSHSRTLERHEVMLTRINADSWSRVEQKQFDRSIDKRLSGIESRLDTIYSLLLRQNRNQ